MKKTLTLLILVAIAQISLGQSYLNSGVGYKAEDVLSSYATFSTYDVHGNYIYGNDGDTIRRFNRETGEEIAKYGKPESYSAFPSFLNVSPGGEYIWAGFTVSGNTDDRIYLIDINDGTWSQVGTLPGNFDLEFLNESILVSALDTSDTETPVSIYSLDTTGENNHREIIELKGNSAGLAVGKEGNVYYGSTDSEAIYQWDSTAVANVLDNSGVTPLTVSEATKLTDLPAQPYDCEIDEANNLLFSFNPFSSDKVMALWNDNSGEGHNFDTLTTTDGTYDWFQGVKSIGNVMNHEKGNGAFVLSMAQPIAKVTREHPPVVSNPLENVQGSKNDDNVSVDLSKIFNDPYYENDFTYEVVLNSDLSIAEASISGQKLDINFKDAGQSNVILRATNAGRSVQDTFVIGVHPNIEGDYHVADFEDNELEPDSYWNGADGSGGFSSSLAYFPNDYNADYGSFAGWAYSNMANDTTPGLSNQYSAITAAGFDVSASGGSNYGLTYVNGASKVRFTDSTTRKVEGLYVTNSTYTALSMKYGDNFSKEFGGPDGDDPDWFKLSVWGYQNGTETDTVEFYLADYRFDDNSKDYIVETWQWVDLSNLGEVDSLAFGLSSSDVGDYGMNTPAYFCVDNIYMENVTSSTGIQNTDNLSVEVYPNPTKGQIFIQSHSGETLQVAVYSVSGKIVHQQSNYSSEELIDISGYPDGVYIIRVRNNKEVVTRKIIKD